MKSPLKSALCGWTIADMNTLDAALASGEYTRAFVDRAVTQQLRSPAPPPIDQRRELRAADDGLAEEVLPECPAWVPAVCKSRVMFSEVALQFGDKPGLDTYILACASQNPYWAVFLELRMLPGVGAAIGSTDPAPPSAREGHASTWSVCYKACLNEDNECFRESPRLVYPDVHFESHGMAWTDMPAVPWATFIADLPVPERPPRRMREDDGDEDDDTIAARHPWVRRLRAKTTVRLPITDESLISSGRSLEVGELDAVQAALREARLELRDGEVDPEPDFIVEARGGPWTMERTGSAIDYYRARPISGLPSEWMDNFWPKGTRSASLPVDKVGPRFAIGLCKTWCSMMTEWYNAWVSNDFRADTVYAELLPRDHATEELVVEVDTFPASHVAKTRWLAFARMPPRRQ